MQVMNINMPITDKPWPAFSVASTESSFEKQFFVFMKIYLFLLNFKYFKEALPVLKDLFGIGRHSTHSENVII